MKNKPRLVVAFALLLGLNLLNPPSAHAWGPDGHKIVALVATKYLTPKARKSVNKILGGQSMESVANWADIYRLSHPETAQWHFVDIELGDDTYLESRDCKDTDTTNEVGGDCAVEAIKHFEGVVTDASQPQQKRLMALKFIIHFVGDIHQPLHSSDDHDRGGNELKVTWFGTSTDLHKVWDGLIIKRAGETPEEFASDLEADITAARKNEIQQGDLVDWVNESHKVAQDVAYPGVKQHPALGQAYYDKTADAVDDQLTKGGLRLAEVLNDLFK